MADVLFAMLYAFINNSVIEKEVAGLIMDGKVQARIDSHLKVGFHWGDGFNLYNFY